MVIRAIKAVAGKAASVARPALRGAKAIRARFDAAETNAANGPHWAFADNLSADAAMSPSVRRTLRSRARYEVANNSYAKGIILSLAYDLIGTGPRLQLRTDNPAANERVERSFARWAREVKLAQKLRTMRIARAESGEAFLVFTTNTGLRHPVKLDVKLIEADQVETPALNLLDPNAVDGIEFDDDGNPSVYHILKQHPGSVAVRPIDEKDDVPADIVIHYFRQDRPGQSRGIPDITPAIPLFGKLRRYTLAVLGAAETAANIAAVIQSQGTADDEPEQYEALDTFELAPSSATVLPYGYTLAQLKAEQPTTTYGEFKGELLDEIVRCLLMPSSVGRGNSSDYNFASGRLDHWGYHRAIGIERDDIEATVLSRIFEAWLAEAILVEGLIPVRERAAVAGLEPPKHQWFWPGLEMAVDPSKQASAQETRLRSRMATYAREYAQQGLDWEEEFAQLAAEKKRMRELGITADDAAAALQRATTNPQEEPDDGDE